MPTYLSPGVYVEEVEAGTRPIEGVGTAVAAFIGFAESGPVNEPILCTNWSQFTSVYGDFLEGAYLHHAVYGFFQNGGGVCYIVRIGSDEGNGVSAWAELMSGGEQASPALRISSIESGPVGNRITVEVADGGEGVAEGNFKLVVREEGRVVEEFENLSTRRGKQNVVTVVNAQSTRIKLEEIAEGTLEKPAVGSVESPGVRMKPR